MKKLLILFLCLTCFGCVTTSISRHVQGKNIEPNKAYLYGKFLDVDRTTNLQLHIITVGLDNPNLKPGYGHGYAFGYDNSAINPIGVLVLLPGEYKLSQLVAISGNARGSLAITDKLLTQTFKVEEGKAYYLGDFYGYFKKGRFGFKSIKMNYKETTESFKRIYPQLESLPTENIF